MKKLVILVAVVVAGLTAIKVGFEKWSDDVRPIGVAEERVQRMLECMQDDPKDEQTALCTWAENKIFLDRDLMKHYEVLWLRFWRESGLKSSNAWRIENVSWDVAHEWVLVEVVEGSRRLTLKVRDGEPIGYAS